MTMTLPLHVPSPKDEILFTVAVHLGVEYLAGHDITRRSLSEAMTAAFGATDAGGLWSMRDAYDAMEAAQVLAIKTMPDSYDSERASTLARLIARSSTLPTQTYRSEGQIELQQFSTPAPIAYLAGIAAAVTATDVVLEPSAGTGLLAVQAYRKTRRVILNEIDPLRASLLARLFAGTTVSDTDGATIADRLSQRPTVVLMNPPYSKSAGVGDDAFAGARHLRSALLALADGGRLVAVMPSWFTPDGSGAAGYAAVTKLVPAAADIVCLGSVYAKHGTAIDVRLMVFDKGRAGPTLRHTAQTLEEALQAVTSLPPRLSLSTPAPALPSTPKTPPSAVGGLLRRSALSRPVAPRAPQLDFAGADVRDVAYTPLAVPLPAADPVGIYVPYRVARIDFTDATPHPTPLVESLAMASIVPPPPTYAPRLPRMAAAALSEAQLETLCYAGQSFERDLPGTYRVEKEGLTLVEDAAGAAYRAGYFLGDGTGAGKGRQVAAVIMDQWVRGSRRHVWVSKTSSLLEDARRDWSALGGVGIDIQPLTDWGLGDPVTMSDGILFTTYATLRSARPEKGSRLDQIIAWVNWRHGDRPSKD